MVAFGGCGPIHAVRIARKLKMSTVVLPPAAGVMSALGLLISPLSFEVATTRVKQWDQVSPEDFGGIFARLRDQAATVLAEAGLTIDEMAVSGRMDLRYAGQGYEVGIDVDLGAADGMAQVPALFAQAYRAIFGLSLQGQTLEAVHWRLEARSAAPGGSHAMHFASYEAGGTAHKGLRSAYDPDTSRFIDHRVIDRYRLLPGDRFEGPALVEEMESTTVLGSGVSARVDEQRNLILEIA
jgi:N-methylhydantoinase A